MESWERSEPEKGGHHEDVKQKGQVGNRQALHELSRELYRSGNGFSYARRRRGQAGTVGFPLQDIRELKGLTKKEEQHDTAGGQTGCFQPGLSGRRLAMSKQPK